MNTIKGVVTAAAFLFAVFQAQAIEGLKIQVQCEDVVLCWPSSEGETYIVQYRPTLDPSTPWMTLTSSLPADVGTNLTFFIHTGAVQNPPCGNGGSFASMMAGNESEMEFTAAETPLSLEPLAMRADGSSDPVPLILYPPGFDLSPFVIINPVTSEALRGSGLVMSEQSTTSSLDPENPGDPQEGGIPSSPPETGFYQVVRDGVYLLSSSKMSLTNGVVAGTISLAFEAGNASYDGTGTNILGSITTAALIVDGTRFPGEAVIGSPQSTSPWQLDFDSGFLENGEHTLWVEVMWHDPESRSGDTYIARQSESFSISVSNQIYYPQWEYEVGEQPISAYFAKTVFTDANWIIDIYDVASNHIQSLAGHTSDGTIEAYWDLKDFNNVVRTNTANDPEFQTVISVVNTASQNFMSASAAAQKKAPKKNQRSRSWPEHGRWVIAFQDFFKYEYSQNNEMQASINAFAFTAAAYGGYYLYYPPQGATNDIGQTYPLRYQKSWHPDPTITNVELDKDIALLKDFLSRTNSRNFYYAGHGNADSIVETALTSAELKKVVKHRYRFVFLDGCSTAKGRLDSAFGINGPGKFALIYYQNTGIRPGAFCGYDRVTPYNVGGPVTVNGIDYDDTIPWQVPGFIFNFLFYWDAAEYPLNLAVSFAQRNLPAVRWWYPGEGLQIYGYDSLKIDEFNYKADW